MRVIMINGINGRIWEGADLEDILAMQELLEAAMQGAVPIPGGIAPQPAPRGMQLVRGQDAFTHQTSINESAAKTAKDLKKIHGRVDIEKELADFRKYLKGLQDRIDREPALKEEAR